MDSEESKAKDDVSVNAEASEESDQDEADQDEADDA